MSEGLPPAILLIDTGRGFWRFWRLRELATDSEIGGKANGKPEIHDGPPTGS